MGEELEALATRLREAAHYCTDIAELERHCKEVAQGLAALAAQQDGVRETLQHAQARFEQLADEHEAAGDTTSWAMCSVDAGRMFKALNGLEQATMFLPFER